MAFQLSTTLRNGLLDQLETLIGTAPTLTLRTGAPPVDANAAPTGTVLATAVLPSDWLAPASSGQKLLSGSWQDASADAMGVAGHFRITGSGLVLQGLVSEPWQGAKTYPAGYQVHNGGNVYRATVGGDSEASGGPTGTGGSITDGIVTWAFIQAGTDMTIDNASLNAGQEFTVTGFTLTMGGA